MVALREEERQRGPWHRLWRVLEVHATYTVARPQEDAARRIRLAAPMQRVPARVRPTICEGEREPAARVGFATCSEPCVGGEDDYCAGQGRQRRRVAGFAVHLEHSRAAGGVHRATGRGAGQGAGDEEREHIGAVHRPKVSAGQLPSTCSRNMEAKGVNPAGPRKAVSDNYVNTSPLGRLHNISRFKMRERGYRPNKAVLT